MFKKAAAKVFGTPSSRYIKTLRPLVARVGDLEPEMEAMDEATLQGATARFRQRLDNEEPLDDMLPEVFATVREAGRCVLKMRHYDV